MAAVQQGSFLEPKNPLVKLTLGRVFESRGQLEQARAAYAEAAGLDPSWPAPRVAAAVAAAAQGDADGALAGVRALPDELQALGRGAAAARQAAAAQGRLRGRREGRARPRRCAALPGLAEAQAALGSAAYNVGELKLAADAYGRAVALEPDNLGYLSNYGLFLGYDDRLEEGLAVLLKVTQRPEGKDPARSSIWAGSTATSTLRA